MYDKAFMGSNTHKQILSIKNKVEQQGKTSEVIYINDFIMKGGLSLQDVIGDEDEE